MTKGTPSQGLKSRGRGKSHIMCRRCGRRSYHSAHKTCSSCGFGNASKLRNYAWATKH